MPPLFSYTHTKSSECSRELLSPSISPHALTSTHPAHPKPFGLQVGQGLNKPAELTLLNVYKTDPATRQPVLGGPGVLKWEKALRQMCAKMGSKFVCYKADGGVWKFEVPHF